jgi:hypothetical protein
MMRNGNGKQLLTLYIYVPNPGLIIVVSMQDVHVAASPRTPNQPLQR